MSRKANAAEIERERANNIVRAVEAAKSARHAITLVNSYAGDGEMGPHLDRAVFEITLIEDILRRKANRGH